MLSDWATEGAGLTSFHKQDNIEDSKCAEHWVNGWADTMGIGKTGVKEAFCCSHVLRTQYYAGSLLVIVSAC